MNDFAKRMRSRYNHSVVSPQSGLETLSKVDRIAQKVQAAKEKLNEIKGRNSTSEVTFANFSAA